MFELRNDTVLMEFVEGRLDRKRAAILEERLKSDARLAVEVEELRRVSAHLRKTALMDLSESRFPGGSPSVWPRVEARIRPVPSRTLSFGPRLALAGAATALIGAVCWFGVKPGPPVQTASNNSTGPSAPSANADNPLSSGRVAALPPVAAFVPKLDSLPFREGAGVGIGSATSEPRWNRPVDASAPPAGVADVTLPAMERAIRTVHISRPDSFWKGEGSPVLAASLPPHAKVAWPDVIHASDVLMKPLTDAVPGTMASSIASMPASDASTDGRGSTGVVAMSNEPVASAAESAPVQVADVPAPATPIEVASAESLPADRAVRYVPDNLLEDDDLVEPTPGPHISFNLIGGPGQGLVTKQSEKPIPVSEIPYLWTKALTAQGDQAVFDGWRDALEASANTMVRQDQSSSDQLDQTLNVIRNAWNLDTLTDKIYQECVTDPDIACWRIMGHVYSLQSDPMDAVYAWTKATQTGVAGAEDWYQLGRADEQTQDFAGARAAYGQVLAFGREYPDLDAVVDDSQQRLASLPGK